MGCGPCSPNSAVTDASAPLVNDFAGSKFSPALTTLLRALDRVEMRMRTEAVNVAWKPSQFPQKSISYNAKPRGTEVVSRATPLYFEENNPYVYDLSIPGPEGGICDGASLCAEPPSNQVPGDTYQSFAWNMQGTAWETPVFCLKDLLYYENGIETLRRFLTNVERTPAFFYDSFIRNLVWDTGEKYILAATDLGMLWNSPDRVSARIAPNLIDFKSFSPAGLTADAASPTLAAIQYLKYIIEQFMGEFDMSLLSVDGQRDLMMVGVEPDIFSFAYNDDTCGPCSFVEGGLGFNMFSFAIINQLPFAVKLDKMWYRGDFDPVSGEFVRIPAKVYVSQNGGYDLRPNPEWLTAPYGVLTFMTARPFNYLTFDNLPDMPSQIPDKVTQYLRPRFEFAPLMEKCNYTRGLVAWRAEDEFGFQPTGEKIIHVIYRRDELASYLRQAKAGACIEEITPCNVPIPNTCAEPQVMSCCPAPGEVIALVDYRDTAYTVSYSGDIATELGWVPGTEPFAAVFQTAKGVFNVQVLAINSTGTLVTFGVDPAEHVGGQFCCEDQLIGFIAAAPTPSCEALLDGGLCPDPFTLGDYLGKLSTSLDAVATDVVTLFFDDGCGQVSLVEFTVASIDNGTRRITLTADPADWPDGVPCEDAVKVCANNTVGCEDCIPTIPPACVPDVVTPIPMTLNEGEVEVEATTAAADCTNVAGDAGGSTSEQSDVDSD